ELARIAIEFDGLSLTNPHRVASPAQAIRYVGSAGLRDRLRAGRHAAAVFPGMAEGGRRRSGLDRGHHRRAVGDAVYHAALRDELCRAAQGAARWYYCAGLCDCDRACRARLAAPDPGHLPGLRGDVHRVDAGGAADRWLCAARRPAVWPEVWSAA